MHNRYRGNNMHCAIKYLNPLCVPSQHIHCSTKCFALMFASANKYCQKCFIFITAANRRLKARPKNKNKKPYSKNPNKQEVAVD